MNLEEPRTLVKKTFESDFDRYNFTYFIGKLLKNVNFNKTFQQSGGNIRKAFQDKVSSFERIGQFTDQNDKTADILIVNLKKDTTLERGRTSLRNFAADYLQSERGSRKSAVLAAYVSDNKKDWRFSFVTLEKERELNSKGNYALTVKNLTPARRYSFLVGKNENSHTAQKQFVDLLNSSASPTLEPIEEAFKIEKVTKEFFERYKELYLKTRLELGIIFNTDEKVKTEFTKKDINLDDFAKKLLGQIVFLYFLQKKGWFGVKRNEDWGKGDKQFLRNLFDKKTPNKNFFNDYLEPLFYEVLAKERDFDYYEKFDCKIPFLNGGLFEPIDNYDWVHADIFLSNELFHNTEINREGDIGTGILDVFDRYNFTVSEAEPLETEVAVDPEMLGKIFEDLLPENERQGKGTYYTPRIVVAYMCQQSLINYLSIHLSKVDKADLEQFIINGSMIAEYQATQSEEHKDTILKSSIVENAKELDKLLSDVKICDPAIGSGAFPVGLLQEIVKARQTLISTGKIPYRSSYELKRYAIENSIYGVDIDSGAIEIAKLRLWLSLIVDEEDRMQVEPLPNLDYKIMQGNCLLEEFHGVSLVIDKVIEESKDDSIIHIADLKQKIAEKSQEFFGLYQQGASGLIKRRAVEKEVESLKKQLDNVTKVSEVEGYNSPLLQDTKTNETSSDLKELESLHDKFRNETRANEKKSLRSRINNLEHLIISRHLTKKQNDLQKEILEITTELKKEIQYLKEVLKRSNETPKIKKLYQELEVKQAQFINVENAQIELNKMEFSKSKPFFLWKLQFSEIFRDKDGFDIVIANPPYLRVQGIRDLDPTFADRLNQIYKSATGSFDLYVIFLEKGLSIINKEGIVNYIMPVKWTNAAFGAGLRQIISEKRYAFKIVSFGAYQVFNASTYTGLQWFRKNSSELLYLELDKDLKSNYELEKYLTSLPHVKETVIPYNKLTKENWILSAGKNTEILNKLNQNPRRLSDIFEKIFQGLATSKDDVYFLYDCVFEKDYIIGFSKQLNKSVKIERTFTKPLLKGEDVHRYEHIKTNRVVIFPYKLDEGKAILFTEEEIRSEFPYSYSYLKQCEEVLRDREKGRLKDDNFWYKYIYPKNLLLFSSKKIVGPEISQGGNFSYDENGDFYSTTKIYGYIKNDSIKESYKFWLGILNSSLFWFFIQQTGYVLRGGYYTFKTNYVCPFPIPTEIPSGTAASIEELVTLILELKRNEYKTNTLELEQKIDYLVYDLYEISEDEIPIINPKQV